MSEANSGRLPKHRPSSKVHPQITRISISKTRKDSNNRTKEELWKLWWGVGQTIRDLGVP